MHLSLTSSMLKVPHQNKKKRLLTNLRRSLPVTTVAIFDIVGCGILLVLVPAGVAEGLFRDFREEFETPLSIMLRSWRI